MKRSGKGSSRTINLHSRRGQETSHESKENVQTFADVLCSILACLNFKFFRFKTKARVFFRRLLRILPSHLISRSVTNRSKSWIQLRSNTLYITLQYYIFLFSAIEIQNLLESVTRWSSILRPTKHWFVFS